jgi:hypothetical protein
MDLNLDNYSLKDLLQLFKLPENFTASQLKEARKMVVAVHPDKSGLDKSYFIFFHKAYSLLHTVYSYKQKAHADMSEAPSFSDIVADMEDTDKRLLANSFTDNPKFNQEFNTLFESLYTKEDDGHGEWLKSNEDLDMSFTNRKQQSRAITISNIEAANTPYHSDIKSVYTIDSVIGVSEEDYRKPKTLQETKTERDKTITPMLRKEAESILYKEQEREGKEATARAFELLQEEQKNYKHQQTFWGKLLTLIE